MFISTQHANILYDFLFSNQFITIIEYEKAYSNLKNFYNNKENIKHLNREAIEQCLRHKNNISILAGSSNKILNYGLFGLCISLHSNYYNALNFALKNQEITSPFSKISLIDNQKLTFTIEPTLYENINDPGYIFSVEYHLSQIINLIRENITLLASVKQITLCYSPTKESSFYKDFFNCEISYNSDANRIIFNLNRDILQNKITTLKYEDLRLRLINILLEYSHNTLHTENTIKNQILNILNNWNEEFPDEHIVADQLNMHPRTLRRKLEKEGETFRDIVTCFKKQKAIQLLINTSMSFKQIAYQVGFHNSSSFTKSFKKWTGELPKNYRKNQ
ncbi:helix-turn-helix transcriptional regulator [Acinetobacter baumannii]|uniref:helix-turn-helix transcriptional regulator n=1 Tax=Acinetobacter baumannii TaxID=470 RepID=UPI00321B6722